MFQRGSWRKNKWKAERLKRLISVGLVWWWHPYKSHYKWEREVLIIPPHQKKNPCICTIVPQLCVHPARVFVDTRASVHIYYCKKRCRPGLALNRLPASPPQVWPSVQSCAGSSAGRRAGGRFQGQKWPCSTTSAWGEPWSSPSTGWDSLRGTGQQVFLLERKKCLLLWLFKVLQSEPPQGCMVSLSRCTWNTWAHFSSIH